MGEEISLTRTGITAEEFAGISHLLRLSKANATVEAFEEATAAAFRHRTLADGKCERTDKRRARRGGCGVRALAMRGKMKEKEGEI